MKNEKRKQKLKIINLYITLALSHVSHIKSSDIYNLDILA